MLSLAVGRSNSLDGNPRVTGYEPGFPPNQAFLDGKWEPDPFVLDYQALIISVPTLAWFFSPAAGSRDLNICRSEGG